MTLTLVALIVWTDLRTTHVT